MSWTEEIRALRVQIGKREVKIMNDSIVIQNLTKDVEKADALAERRDAEISNLKVTTYQEKARIEELKTIGAKIVRESALFEVKIRSLEHSNSLIFARETDLRKQLAEHEAEIDKIGTDEDPFWVKACEMKRELKAKDEEIEKLEEEARKESETCIGWLQEIDTKDAEISAWEEIANINLNTVKKRDKEIKELQEALQETRLPTSW